MKKEQLQEINERLNRIEKLIENKLLKENMSKAEFDDFMLDPMYKEVIDAVLDQDMNKFKKKMDNLLSIRGSSAKKNVAKLLKYIKNLTKK